MVTKVIQCTEPLRQPPAASPELLRILEAAAQVADWSELFFTLTRKLPAAFGADSCQVLLWEARWQRCFSTGCYCPRTEDRILMLPRPGELGMSQAVMAAGRPLAIEDVYTSPYENLDRLLFFPTKSLLGLPLIAEDQALGVLMLGFNQHRHFTTEDIDRAHCDADRVASVLNGNKVFCDVFWTQQRIRLNVLAQA